MTGQMDDRSNHEATLVQRAAAGDQAAFADLYERYFDAVYDFLTRLLKDRDAAADVTQDTFIKAMNAIGSLKEGASFKSWLFTIAHNTGLNHLKRASRTQPMPGSDDEDEPAFDVVDTDRFGSPEEAAEATQLAALVWEAAAGMDARQYAVLDLTLRQGLESAEVADVLGVSKNNGYVLVNRMKKTLEESVAALLLFRDRRHCEQLTALLATHEVAGMSPDTRRLIDRHAGRCEVCQRKRASLVSPSAIFGGLAFIPAPLGLKLSIGEALQAGWGAAAGAGGAAAGGNEPSQYSETSQYAGPPDGQAGATWQPQGAPADPHYLDPEAAARQKRNLVAAGVAAVAAVIFGLAIVLGSGSDSDSTDDSRLVLGATPPGIETTASVLGLQPTAEATAEPAPTEDPSATETPEPEVTVIAVLQPGATPSTGGVAPLPGPGPSTPVPAMPGPPDGLAPGGSGPSATPTPQSLVLPPPTPTTAPPPVLPTATPQAGTFVATVTPPTATPTPKPCVPTAVIAASTIDFGTSTSPQTITLKSDGCTPAMSFAATPGSNWISTTPGSGSIPLNGQQVVSIRPLPGNMANGLNSGRVRVTTAQGIVDIAIRASKASSVPPTPTRTPCPAPCLAAP